MKFEKEMMETPLPYTPQPFNSEHKEVLFAKSYDFDPILYKIYPNHFQHTLLIKSIIGLLKSVLTDDDFKQGNVPDPLTGKILKPENNIFYRSMTQLIFILFREEKNISEYSFKTILHLMMSLLPPQAIEPNSERFTLPVFDLSQFA
jgi:hypothetical protein